MDEIDSILSLPFAVDNFFALIRFCYNQRAINPEYQRITFAIFGVATPSDLIQNKTRTPFNIGQAIELEGFNRQEVTPLIRGLEGKIEQPHLILKEILAWTDGQPFLTQKICGRIAQLHPGKLRVPPGTESFWIETLIKTQIIERWESQDEPEHLRTIRDSFAAARSADRIERNEQQAGRMLGIYQQILQGLEVKSDDSREQIELLLSGLVVRRSGILNVKNRIYQQVFNLKWVEKRLAALRPYSQAFDAWVASQQIERNEQQAGRMLGIYQQILQGLEVKSDDSREQIELLLSGLVVRRSGILNVKNRIYQQVFNLKWVEKRLAALRPYSQAFDAWVASQQKDESRLLRGQALKDAQLWAQGKSLSDLDYQFFGASEALDRKEAQLAFEAERAKDAEARLRLQGLFLGAISTALVIASGLGLIAFWQYRKAVAYGQEARLSEIKALVSSSKGFFASNQKLNALIAAIKAKHIMQQMKIADVQTEAEIKKVLQSAVYSADEFNRLLGHKGGVLGVDFSPNGQLIATASNDKTVKLWKRDGTLLKTLKHNATVYRLKFSPNGQVIAAAGLDGIISLWALDGSLLRTLQGHKTSVWEISFSPDGKNIVSASADKTVKLWTEYGTLLKTFEGHQSAIWSVAFSSDNQTIASVDMKGVIKLWHRKGTLLKSWIGNQAGVWDVKFSPDGQTIISASGDNTVKLWKLDGTKLQTFTGHSGEINAVAFSPDGTKIASASADKTVRIFNTDGTLVKIFKGHDGVVRHVAFSPDGQIVATASEDSTAKLWQLKSGLLQQLNGYTTTIWGAAFSPDGQLLATGSIERTLKLWRRDGKLLKTIKTENGLGDVAFSPQGKLIAAAGDDNTITLWRPNGTRVKTLRGHTSALLDLAFSPDGQMLVSGSDDNTVKLWKLNGTLLKTFQGHQGRVWSVDYSRDGQIIASASADNTVKLWRPDGSLLRTIKGHNNGVCGVAITPDSQIIASASRDGTVKLWRRDGTLLKTLDGDSSGFIRVAFSPNGQIIAASSGDNTVKLWKIDGTSLTTLGGGHTSVPMIVAFSPDNKFLASAGDDQTVILWDLERILKLDLRAYGCNWVRDYLRTSKEVEEGDRHLCEGINMTSK